MLKPNDGTLLLKTIDDFKTSKIVAETMSVCHIKDQIIVQELIIVIWEKYRKFKSSLHY